MRVPVIGNHYTFADTHDPINCGYVQKTIDSENAPNCHSSTKFDGWKMLKEQYVLFTKRSVYVAMHAMLDK